MTMITRGGRQAVATTPAPAPYRYSSNDWAIQLVSLLLGKSKVFQRISSHLLFSTIWSLFLAVMYEKKRHLMQHIIISNPLIWSVLSSALSLLLVFRTNSAYDRFWEARKLLGALLNSSRNLALIGNQSCGGNKWNEKEKIRFSSLLRCFPKLLLAHLAYEDALPSLRNSDVSTEDKSHILGAKNKPLALLQLLQTTYAPYTSRPDLMGLSFSEISNVVGACERIVRTPVPQSYSRHTSRFLSLFSFSLPLVLLPTLNFLVVPVTFFHCWALFSIEEIGHGIENPFDPLTRDELLSSTKVANVIESDVEEIMRFSA